MGWWQKLCNTLSGWTGRPLLSQQNGARSFRVCCGGKTDIVRSQSNRSCWQLSLCLGFEAMLRG